MDKVLKVEGLAKRYRDFALEDVTFSVEPGTVVGFVGENGAGKTTTIKAILGLIGVDAGTVELLGQPVAPSSRNLGEIKQRVGVVFDTCSFPVDSTVSDVASIGKAAYRRWDAPAFSAYVRAFGIDGRKRVKELSRGMGMKLSLAFALAHDSDALILDEATAGLDPLARDEALDILREFMAGGERGILLSSHITSDLEKIADEVVCIHGGRIAFDVPKEEICDFAGIARCRTREFDRIARDSAAGAVRFARREYGIDVLVADRYAFAAAYPDIVVEGASIDGYLALMLKGLPFDGAALQEKEASR